MPLGWYYSDSGAKFNSGAVQSALTQRKDSVLLFPVYRGTRGSGSNSNTRSSAGSGST